MTNRLAVAVAQFTVAQDPDRNLEIIDGFAGDAAARSARLLVLPEGLIARDGDDDGFAAAHAQPLDGSFVRGLRRISAERGIALMGTVHALEAPDVKADGSAENAGDVGSGDDQAQELGQEPLRARSPRVSNMFLVIRDGEIIASYRKLHLYDAFAARESDVVRPGTELPPIVDIDGWKIGVMTCYDVRFPETARSLAVRGADAIVVSAAWVRGAAKEYHWSLMTAARAVENTCYVLACSEVSKRNIGCSRIIGPLGEVIAQAGDSEAEMITATLDRAALADARRTLPVLDNRRFADPVLR
ncbi:hydrolase [Bifidobacterium tissieri]|uniref:Hydrolase n=1 Tax=Bifidobacterium tissieri TaxID=1630162 RepID=A0A261FH32_9BIFI|nr:nitrilase-related carbon-nitrogen hydrolase [Bifidobacterium tissieri]OZG58462.1 hydrolase [Bifidobacterium tissieri]